MNACTTGGCLCGAVQYEISAPPAFAGNCHCSICRRAHGSRAHWHAITDEPPQHEGWPPGMLPGLVLAAQEQ